MVCAFDGIFVFETTEICIPSKRPSYYTSINMVLEWTHQSKVQEVQSIHELVSSFLDTTRVSIMRILQNSDTNTVCAIDYIFVYETIGVCLPIKKLAYKLPFQNGIDPNNNLGIQRCLSA